MGTGKSDSALCEWKNGWRTVVSAFLLAFISEGIMFSFGILLVEIINHFETGRAETAATVSTMAVTMHIIGPLAVALAERFGHRTIVIIGSFMSSTGLFFCWFATNVYYLWVLYGFVGGLGFGLMMTANVCVLQAFEKHRALANGITVCGSGTGTFVLNYCLPILIDYFGWRGTILLESAIIMHGVVLGLLLSPSKNNVTKNIDRHTSCTSNVKLVLTSIFKRELLTNPKCILILLSTLIVSFAFLVPTTFIPDQAEQEGMTKTEAAMLTSSIGIANIISRVVFGWIGDRICCRRLYLLVVITFLIGSLTGVSPIMDTFETKLVYTIMFGTLVGVLYDKTGSYTVTFIVSGAEFILGALFLLLCTCKCKLKKASYQVNA